jgi:hypothetical protein
LARLGVEGHPPLARVAEHLVQQHHLSRLRQIQACLGRRMRLGARSEPVILLTSLQQARSDQQTVGFLEIFLYSEPLTFCFLYSKFQCWGL